MSDEFELLMVGGGPPGLAAARAYRAAGGRGAVAIVADEHRVPYNRPPLTKELLRGESSEDELPIEPEAWSNVPALAEHYFAQVDGDVCDRAMKLRDGSGHLIVGGENYGQGSSREHGALIPAFLGLRAVIAKWFARIHGQNLVNFGVVPLLFCDPGDHDAITPDTVLRIDDVHDAIRACEPFDVHLGDSMRASACATTCHRDRSTSCSRVASSTRFKVTIRQEVNRCRHVASRREPSAHVSTSASRKVSSTAGPASAVPRRSRRGQ
jgi:hypothetical protein